MSMSVVAGTKGNIQDCERILLIIEKEFDWLKRCEQTAATQQSTQGNLQIVQEDVDTHYVSEMLGFTF